MQYKSSFTKCVLGFFMTSIFLIFLLMIFSLAISWLTIGNDEWQRLARSGVVRIMIIRSLISSSVAGILIGSFLEFYIRRIRIEITDDAIAFFRGKREYAYFPHESFIFGALVHVERAEGGIPFSSRYLRITLRYGERKRNYRCYHFSANTFSEFISHVRASALSYEQARQHSRVIDREIPLSTNVDKTPLRHKTFHINKEILAKRQRSIFMPLLLACFLPALLIITSSVIVHIMRDSWFWDNFRMQPGLNIMLFFLLLIPLVITGIPPFVFGSRFFEIKRNTPQRIEVYPDKLVIDSDTFYLSRVRQIKMTPPNFGDGDIFIKRRILSIISDNSSRKFVISDSRDIESPLLRPKKEFAKAFVEYPMLFNILQSAFEGEPDKFTADLK